MKKNKIILAVLIVMVAVIVFVGLNKKDTMSLSSGNKMVNNNQGIYTDNYAQEGELSLHGMGEEVMCRGLFDNNGEKQYDDFSYTINDACLVNRISNVPQGKEKELLCMESGGYAEKGYVFMVADVDIKNLSARDIEHYMNCTDIKNTPALDAVPISSPCCYSSFENAEKKDYFKIDIAKGGEYHTKLVFVIEKNELSDEMYMVINPNAGIVADGAGAVKLDVKADDIEDEMDI